MYSVDVSAKCTGFIDLLRWVGKSTMSSSASAIVDNMMIGVRSSFTYEHKCISRTDTRDKKADVADVAGALSDRGSCHR